MQNRNLFAAKSGRIVYWIVTGWLALGMLSTGVVQLLQAKEGQGGADMLLHLGYPAYLLTLLGTWKILGVIALLVPTNSLAKEWAYAGFFFIMSGAIFSHIASGDQLSKIAPAFLLVVLTLVSRYLQATQYRKSKFVKHRGSKFETYASESKKF